MGRPATFDLDELAAAGLALVAERGWDAVSIRSVADQVGVSTMALYRLAPDSTGLKRLIADAAGERIQPAAASPGDVIDELGRWAPRAFRQFDHYPGLASYVVASWTELARWLDIVESMLARATGEGRSGSEAVAVVNAVFAYVLARAQLRDSIRAAGPRRLGPVRHEPDRYPNIRRNRPSFAVPRTATHFRIGLDALLTGLRRG